MTGHEGGGGQGVSEPSLTIRGDAGDRLHIRVGHRSQTDILDSEDGNWLACAIELRLGGFQGRVAASLRAEDFRSFREELRSLDETLKGTAAFTTMGGWIGLRLEADKRGGITASGHLVDDLGAANRLHFRLVFDQTELGRMFREVDSVVRAFPVVGE